MQNLRILNSKERKEVVKRINAQWGCEFKTELVMLRSSNDKIYLITRDIEKIDLTKLRVDTMGVYFATLTETEIRLSIEGSEIIGPIATNNALELADAEAREWLKGNDLHLDETEGLNGFIILKNKKDFLGTGKLRGNDLLSYIPKNRRILCDD